MKHTIHQIWKNFSLFLFLQVEQTFFFTFLKVMYYFSIFLLCLIQLDGQFTSKMMIKYKIILLSYDRWC